MQLSRPPLSRPPGSHKQQLGIPARLNVSQTAAQRRPGRPAAAAAPPPGSDDNQARRAEAQEALLAALREAGVPLDNIQLGRADDDDDEEWLDVLDAETDEWMRKPQVPEIVEELLGGDVAAAARQMDEEQRRRREQRQQQQQPPGGPE